MLKSYFTIATRNLLKNKIFSLVNILGLAIGMAACFFIFLYVHFERSYDRFHKNAANLYRVNVSSTGSLSNFGPTATNHPAVAPAMKADFPEVVGFARAVSASLFGGTATLSYTNDKAATVSFNENKIFIVDSSFLTLFSFPLIAGNAKNALVERDGIVLSESTAKKYFGNENPLGKTLYLNKQVPFKVTGVVKDVPENSHLKFDMLASFTGFEQSNNWTWPEFYNYVLLAPDTDPKKLEAKFPAFIEKHMGAIMKQYNFRCQFHLQRITDIHLSTAFLKEPEITGNKRDVYFLSIIGVLILIVAWINYINLTTAKSMERAKEVGLRKVVGASKMQLATQFVSESFIVNLLAILIGAVLIVSCFPFFGRFIGKNISEEFLSSGLLQQPSFWLAVTGLFVIGAFGVGAYPAFVLIRYKPALVLKGKFTQSARGIFLRKSLVSVQFLLSILLIAGTIVVYKQLAFMQNGDLGYNKDQILVVKAPAATDSTFGAKVNAFKTELQKNPAVSGVTGTTDIPGQLVVWRNSVRKPTDTKTNLFTTYIMGTDENFVNTYQVTLAAGHGFAKTDTVNFFGSQRNARIMVNEEVVKALGFASNEAAVGQHAIFAFIDGEYDAEIIGVVKSYHQRSLREVYDPILYIYPTGDNWAYLSVQINTKNLPRNLASVEASYKTFFDGSPFQFFFLNEFFNNQYQADQRFGKVFSLFTVLAIFVACLGLLGLSSFMSRLRTKEIGIRKVLGASVSSILVLFSKDFVKLLCFATVIAVPIIYYTAHFWLQNYAFHISLSWMLFIVPPVLLLCVALITISIQSLKAALANPVHSIHTE